MIEKKKTHHGFLDPADPKVITVNRTHTELAAEVIENLKQVEELVKKIAPMTDKLSYHKFKSKAYWCKLKETFFEDIGIVGPDAELTLDYDDQGNLYILPEKKKSPFKMINMGKFKMGEEGFEIG